MFSNSEASWLRKSDQDSTASTRMNCRRRPLHTWGVSAIAIAHKAYIKSQDHLNEPIGSMAKRIVTLGSHLVSSILFALQHFWLAIFFYIDACILALENVVESFFPPSRHVFNKVDEIVRIIETLPAKFDDILDEFAVIIEQVPLLDCALGQAIHWGSGNTKEKEIVVDTGYNESNGVLSAAAITDNNESKLPTEYSSSHVGLNNKEKFPLASEKPKTEAEKIGEIANSSAAKGTYKEVLERGKRENIEKKRAKKDGNPDDTVIVKLEAEDSSKRDGIAMTNDYLILGGL